MKSATSPARARAYRPLRSRASHTSSGVLDPDQQERARAVRPASRALRRPAANGAIGAATAMPPCSATSDATQAIRSTLISRDLGVEPEPARQVLADLVAVEQRHPSRPRVGELVGQRTGDRRLARAGQPGEEHDGARAVGPAQRAQDLARRRGRVEGRHPGLDHRGHGPGRLVALRQVARQVDDLADAGLGELRAELRRPRHDEADDRGSGVVASIPSARAQAARVRPAQPTSLDRCGPRLDPTTITSGWMSPIARSARRWVGTVSTTSAVAALDLSPRRARTPAADRRTLRVPLRARSSGHRRQRPDRRGGHRPWPRPITSASGVFSASVRTSCSPGGGADSAEGGSQPPRTSSSRSSPSSSSTTRGTRERSVASGGFDAGVMDGRRRSPGGARPQRSAAHRGPARSTRPSRRPGSA